MCLNEDYLHNRLLPYCASANNVYVGYSGGIDSHVLLHLLATNRQFKSRITAVYIHHGLQVEADDWAIHCQQTASDLGVNFQVFKVDAQAQPGESPEATARDARYQAFAKILSKNDVLVFAQHRDDQLETFLLQLFRGAGLKGLSAMPEAISFAQGQLLRPLLAINKEQIKRYAHEHDLSWIEDPSNQDNKFDRNYLRNEVIPLLEQRWPSLDKTISRVAGHCANAQTQLSDNAKQKMHLLYDPENQSLSIKALFAHDKLTQQLIVREWLDLLGTRMPSQKVMNSILHNVLSAHADATPLILHDGYTIRRYRDDLYLVATNKRPELNQNIVWTDKGKSLVLPDNGQLDIKEASRGIAKAAWQQGKVEVKYRQGGEKIRLPNRNGRHSLKKLYQEAGIVPWQRENTPLIYINAQLAAIAGYWVSADYYTQDIPCIQIRWV